MRCPIIKERQRSSEKKEIMVQHSQVGSSYGTHAFDEIWLLVKFSQDVGPHQFSGSILKVNVARVIFIFDKVVLCLMCLVQENPEIHPFFLREIKLMLS